MPQQFDDFDTQIQSDESRQADYWDEWRRLEAETIDQEELDTVAEFVDALCKDFEELQRMCGPQ